MLTVYWTALVGLLKALAIMALKLFEITMFASGFLLLGSVVVYQRNEKECIDKGIVAGVTAIALLCLLIGLLMEIVKL